MNLKTIFSQLLFIAAAITGLTLQAIDKPNIVIIFTDDMGYGDIAPFGSKVNKTPALARMAAEGLVLTDFYVSSSACTPSRAALMTGTYAERIGMGRSVVFPKDERGLNPSEVTIADMLKEQGYTTGCFGKWHLGDAPEFMPLAQGFDVYEGIPYSNDMWNPKGQKARRFYPPLPYMRQNQSIAHVPDIKSQTELTDAYTDAAVKFISTNKDKPFFAYIPHSAPHVPQYATPEQVAAADGNVYNAVIANIDENVGRVLETLRQLGIDKKTLVIFTNDNGGFGKAQSGPIRGSKFGPKYEGHMRVSTLAWWPGKVPAGAVTGEIGTTTDLLPTIAAICGGKVPTDRIIDGKDISPVLLGQPGAKSPHENLFYESDGLRQGKWKYVRYRIKGKNFDELYMLDSDLGETTNVAKQYPEKLAAMKATLQKHAEDIKTNQRPAAFTENPVYILPDASGLPTLYELRKGKK